MSKMSKEEMRDLTNHFRERVKKMEEREAEKKKQEQEEIERKRNLRYEEKPNLKYPFLTF